MKLAEVSFVKLEPGVLRLQQWLDKAPADEVFTVQEMRDNGFGDYALTHAFSKFPDYRTKWGTRTIWGNPKAILAFRKKAGL